MTRAYGVLAAEGWRAELRPVREVIGPDDEVIVRHEPAGTHALGRAETHLVTSVLRGVVDRGTGYGVRALGFHGPVAGKTGTTDDYRDAWFIGYTPDFAVGVWVGFDDGRTLRHSGSRAALPIVARFLTEALSPLGGRAFPVPPGVETATVVAAQGHRAGLLCNGEREVFLEGTAPGERCSPWDWFAADRLRYVGGRPPGELGEATPAVGSGPDERARAPLWHLPEWLNPFRERRRTADGSP
jgi:penicillin-binding protein 1B